MVEYLTGLGDASLSIVLIPISFYIGVHIYSPATRKAPAAPLSHAFCVARDVTGWACAVTPFAVVVLLGYQYPGPALVFLVGWAIMGIVAPILFCTGWAIYSALGLSAKYPPLKPAAGQERTEEKVPAALPLGTCCSTPITLEASEKIGFPGRVLRTTILAIVVFACTKPEMVVVFTSFVFFQVAPFSFAPTLALYLLCALLYLGTYRGQPETSGCRALDLQSDPVATFFTTHFKPRILRVSSQPFDLTDEGSTDTVKDAGKTQRYMFGYHPHGILPLGATWAKLLPEWAELFPGINPITMTASIMHQMPILRDMTQWTSSRDITRTGIIKALQARGSVLVVPGGQAEMLPLCGPVGSGERDMVLMTAHRGFIRIALKYGIDLVPVYNFGETKVLDNVPFPLNLQRELVRVVRANAILTPYGFPLTCPRSLPCTVVVGKPINVRALQVDEPTKQQVDTLARLYYTAVTDIFEGYKQACGHKSFTLRLEPHLEPLRKKDKEDTSADTTQSNQAESGGLSEDGEWESAWETASSIAPSQEDVDAQKRRDKAADRREARGPVPERILSFMVWLFPSIMGMLLSRGLPVLMAPSYAV
jgi:2-acylglycerol O-acyltransferase 2